MGKKAEIKTGRRKYVFCDFREYEGDAFALYLEQMAARGWFAKERIGSTLWRFESGQPAQRRYWAAVMPGSSLLMTEESGEEADYRELCREAGWEPECGDHIWQIFYTERGDSVPVETDPKLRLENIRSIILTPWAVAIDWIWTVFLVGLLLFVVMTETFMSSAKQQAGAVVLLLMAAFWIGRQLQIMKWYKRAEECVAGGGELPKEDPEKVMKRGRMKRLASIAVLLIGIWIPPLINTLLFIAVFNIFYRAVLGYLRENREVFQENQCGRRPNGERWRIVLTASVLILFIGFMTFFDLTKRVLPAWQQAGVRTEQQTGVKTE